MKMTKRNGMYVLDYRDANGKRKRKSMGTRDKDEASRKAQAFLSGRDPTGETWTLNQALDHCYTTVWQHNKSWKTMQSVTKKVRAAMGPLLVQDVTYELLNGYVQELRGEGLSPATINRRLACISKALNESAKLGKLPAAPPIPLQSEDNKRTRFLTEEEEALLLAYCEILVEPEATLMHHLIVFLVDTGARLGEARRFYPEHLQQGTVLFMDTKSTIDKPKHRRVPLTPRAYAAARELAVANRTGAMLSVHQLEKRLKRVREFAGVEDVTFHTMRHTCASRLIQRGAQIHEVRDWLGHSSVVVTERYAHLAESSLSHLTDLLGAGDLGTTQAGQSSL